VTLSRAPFYVGVLGSAYGFSGRYEEALQLQRELDERQARGEYVPPITSLMIAVARDDRDGIRMALGRCVDDATPPLTILATCRTELDALREDAEIDRMLDVLYDGARPPRER